MTIPLSDAALARIRERRAMSMSESVLFDRSVLLDEVDLLRADLDAIVNCECGGSGQMRQDIGGQDVFTLETGPCPTCAPARARARGRKEART